MFSIAFPSHHIMLHHITSCTSHCHITHRDCLFYPDLTHFYIDLSVVFVLIIFRSYRHCGCINAHLLPYSIPMAYLHRVSKPVQDWNQEDLLAYNIHVHPQPQSVFFNGLRCSGGALPSISPTSPLNPFLTTP